MRNEVTTRHISGGNFQRKYWWKMNSWVGRIPRRLPTEEAKTAVAKALDAGLDDVLIRVLIGAYLAIGGARK